MRSDNLAPVQLEVVESLGLQTDADGWQHYAYVVRLARGDESMTIPWRQGTGITESPDVASVLDAVLSDAAGFVNARDFEEWAAEYGYDSDSRKAYALYQQVDEQTEQLRDVLGEDFDSSVFPEGEQEEVIRRLIEA